MSHEPVATLVGEPAISEVLSPDVVRAPGGGVGSDRTRKRPIAWIAFTDALVFTIALLLVIGPPASAGARLVIAVCAVATVCTEAAFRLYGPTSLSPMDEAKRIAAATGLLLVIVATTDVAGDDDPLSGRKMGIMWALAAGLLVGERCLWRYRLRQQDSRAAARDRVALILGNDTHAQRVARSMSLSPTGLLPAGYLCGDDAPRGNDDDDTQRLGSTSEIAAAVQRTGATVLVVIATAFTPEEVLAVLREARRLGLEVRVITGLPVMVEQRLSVDRLADTMSLRVALPTLTPLQAVVKRTFDIVVSALLLVLLAVPMAIIAVAVRTSSTGGAIFKQVRVTRGGQGFTMYKFRSMVSGATSDAAPEAEDRSVLFFKLGGDDPRITRLGAVLRKTSLDELPQLWNVLKGDMSLVGPRPLPIEQVTAHLELLESRHEVRAGISGWWQVHGRSGLEPTDSVEMDLYYIDNWSLGLDLKILGKTFGAVLSQRGAE